MLVGGCKPIKLGRFYLSENHQKPKQAYHQIRSNPDTSFQFHSSRGDYQQFIENIEFHPPSYKNKKGDTYRLVDYLHHQTKTTAFLVIRRDTILFEKYFEGYDEYSLLPSFSVAKSFTSSLIGIAIQEGKIHSESDLVITYLPELEDIHPYWSLMTIEHLLNMRSGISFNEENYVNPYSGVAQLYMSKDVRKVLQRVKFQAKPGQTHYYSSLDTEILGLVLERVIGKPLPEYLQEKIWHPCGMESQANWAIDSRKANHTKAFCCINAIARDYAKFGRLYLHKGNWNGQQLINTPWIEKSILPNFDNNCYQYQWYSQQRGMKSSKNEAGKYQILTFSDSLAASKHITHNTYESVRRHRTDKEKWVIQQCGPGFYALGIFGQEIYLIPDKEMIFIRLGKKWDTPSQRIFSVIQHKLTTYEPM